MLLAPLPILPLLYFFLFFLLLHHPIFSFAGKLPPPYSTDDDIDGPNNMCPPHSSTFLPPKLQKLIFLFGRGNTLATCLIIVVTILNIIVYKLRQLQEENSTYGKKEENSDKKLNLPSSFSSENLCRRFSFREIMIQLATRNFDDELVIGQGGFGKVYKGCIDNGELTVAIKRLNRMSKQGAIEFWTEIKMLSTFRHSHVVSIIGYCDNCHEMILVYKYMINGTLADHLYKNDKNDNSPLSWVQRLKICIGAAQGLDYLHTCIQDRVIHRDVKSSNILLDENWAAKISDFGLSKIGPANQSFTLVTTSIKGTYGYLDPEYFLTRRLTRKSDVYAFGVVLFEVLCGRSGVDLRLDEEQWGLAGWAQHCVKEGTLPQIIDPSLKWQILQDSLMTFVDIAEQCLHRIPKKRPTMAEVVVRLELALALQERRGISMVEDDLINIDGAYDNQENANTSMAEGEIISIGKAYDNQENANSSMTAGEISTTGGAYDNQETVDSSTKQEVINAGNGGHQDEHIYGNIQLGNARSRPSRVTFTRKVRMIFSGTSRVTTVHTDAMPSRRNKSNNSSSSNSALPNKDGCVVQEVSGTGQTVMIPSLVRFTFAGLQEATKKFKTDMLLGRGRFGVVFKGWVDEKSYSPFNINVWMAIAVKKLESDCIKGNKELKAKLEFLGTITHPNLVKLWGYCSEVDKFLLVYDYMQNGSLEDHLFRKYAEPLPWVTRLKISLGAARGLAFLHAAKNQVIYRCFSSSNILLDGDFNAKLSDFELASLDSRGHHDDSYHTTALSWHVRNDYAAPEYLLAGHFSTKSDVYCFGLVLLEILTGRRLYDKRRPMPEHNLVNWARPLLSNKRMVKTVLDPRLKHDYPQGVGFLSVLPRLILTCLEYDPRDRPSMEEVLETLEKINSKMSRACETDN